MLKLIVCIQDLTNNARSPLCYTRVPHFIVFCFLVFFTNWKFVATLCQTFPIAFAHFMSLCPILVILPIFQTFSLLLYLLWWSMLSDLRCDYCKEIMTCQRLRWWLAIFSNKVFLKLRSIHFLDITLLHT